MIGIVISTYQRPDGKTSFYLKRALESISKQEYKDYKIIVVGDDYGDIDELRSICNSFDAYWINLPIAKEREKYPFGDYRLFCAGGVNAGLEGIKQALKFGCEYICHLDHDDWWEPNHLKLIAKQIVKNPLFVCTMSTYWGNLLPLVDPLDEVHEYYPRPGGCCLSASCIKYSDTPIRFRDHFAEKGEAYPADADFWIRLADFMRKNNRKGYITTTVTCHHDEEGYSFRGDFG